MGCFETTFSNAVKTLKEHAISPEFYLLKHSMTIEKDREYTTRCKVGWLVSSPMLTITSFCIQDSGFRFYLEIAQTFDARLECKAMSRHT